MDSLDERPRPSGGAGEEPAKVINQNTTMSQTDNQLSPVGCADLFAFAEEYLIPVLRYTADKKAYIFDQESKYYTGQDRDDFDQWANHRAKLAIEKWDAMRKANAAAQTPPDSGTKNHE